MTIEYASLDDVWNVPFQPIHKPKNKKKKSTKNDVICQLINKKNNQTTENIVDDYLSEFQNEIKYNKNNKDTYKELSNTYSEKPYFCDNSINGIDGENNVMFYNYTDLMNKNDCTLLDESFTNENKQNNQNSKIKDHYYQTENEQNNENEYENNVSNEEDDFNPTYFHKKYKPEKEMLSDEELDDEYEDDDDDDSENINKPIKKRKKEISTKEGIFDIILYILSGVILIFILEQILKIGTFFK